MQVINPLNYLVGIESQPKKETLSTLEYKVRDSPFLAQNFTSQGNLHAITS